MSNYDKLKVPAQVKCAAEEPTLSAEALAQMKVAARIGKDGLPFTVVSLANGAAQVVDLSKYMGPQRRPVLECTDVESFCDYVNHFKEKGTRIFAHNSGNDIWAIIDYHKTGTTEASACGHQVKLRLDYSESAAAWINRDGKPQSQADFADFLEDRYVDMLEPTGADMLEIAKTLEMKPNVHFKSAQRQHDGGYNLIYNEEAQTSAGSSGNIEVPSRIKIRLRLFKGGEFIELEARLLYRMREGCLTFSVRFIRLQEVILQAQKDSQKLIALATELPCYAGRVASFV